MISKDYATQLPRQLTKIVRADWYYNEQLIQIYTKFLSKLHLKVQKCKQFAEVNIGIYSDQIIRAMLRNNTITVSY